MTMGDVVLLVAGVAVSVAFTGGEWVNPFHRSPDVELARDLTRFFQGMSLAVSVVALGRVGLYRRMPSATEWLGILVGGSLFGEWSWLDLDRWICAFQLRKLSCFCVHEYGIFLLIVADLSNPWGIGKRWRVAGLFTVVIAIGLGLFRIGRRRFPTWLKTVLLAWLAVLTMTGPLWVFSVHGADLISPSGGFGPGVGSILHRGACLLVAALPMGLFFGLPAVASLRERIGGRRWTWVEWTAAGSSTLTGFVGVLSYRGEFRTPSLAWLAERLMVLAWLAIVAVLSRWILIRFGPPWRRWIEGPMDHDRSSLPASDSEASIR
jgi:hypothetical protein